MWLDLPFNPLSVTRSFINPSVIGLLVDTKRAKPTSRGAFPDADKAFIAGTAPSSPVRPALPEFYPPPKTSSAPHQPVITRTLCLQSKSAASEQHSALATAGRPGRPGRRAPVKAAPRACDACRGVGPCPPAAAPRLVHRRAAGDYGTLAAPVQACAPPEHALQTITVKYLRNIDWGGRAALTGAAAVTGRDASYAREEARAGGLRGRGHEISAGR